MSQSNDVKQYIQNIAASGPGTTGAYSSYVGGLYPVDTNGSPIDSDQTSQLLFNSLVSTLQNSSPGMSTPAAANLIEAFFKGYTASNAGASNITNLGITARPLPTSFNGFIQDLLKYANVTIPADITTTSAYKTFLNLFKTYLQTSGTMHGQLSSPTSYTNYQLDTVISGNNADWGTLPSTVSNAAGAATNIEDVEFQNTFAVFLKNFPSSMLENVRKNADGSVTYNFLSSSNFLDSWNKFITATSTLELATKDNVLQFTDLGGQDYLLGTSADANQSILNYQSIYKAFFPNASDSDFQAYMQNFYNKIVNDPSKGGYFNPSHFVDEFFAEVKAKYLLPMSGHGANFDFTKPRLSIIWEVLAHIRDMVSVIQNISVYVSQRLNFQTAYQKAYTDLIATIPTFKAGTPFGTDDTVSINNTLNNYRTNLSSYRDQVTADSKKIQSFVDSLSQGSTNALNQGSALLTMMNGLLSIIHA